MTACKKNSDNGDASSVAVKSGDPSVVSENSSLQNNISDSLVDDENQNSSIRSGSASENTNQSSMSQSKITSAVLNKKTIDKDNNGNFSFDNMNASVNVDYSLRQGMPLFKKYSYFIIGDTPMDRVARYAYYLKELRARNARFSLTVQATEDDEAMYKYHMLGAMYAFGDSINQYATPYWHMSYVKSAINPEAAVSDSQNAVFYEPVYPIWNNAWKTVAKYFKDKGVRCYYEVWNEPDIDLWTKFNWDGYIRMYENTATALRKGNPDAFVGGIAAAHLSNLGIDKYRKFLDTIQKDTIPIDFVSFHNYGDDYPKEITNIKAELAARPYYNKTQIHYTEFNVYSPPYSEWYLDYSERKDFTLQKSKIIPDMFNAINYLNSQTDVSIIQWASLMDGAGAFSVINPNGTRAATYYGQYVYMHMPVERVKSSVNNQNIGVMSSADTTMAATLAWNNSQTEQNTTINLKNIPYTNYEVTLYRIDSNHSSINENSDNDKMAPLERITGCDKSTLSWSGKIPGKGTIYIELKKTGAVPELDQAGSVGRIIRNDNYYQNRTQNSYADFDDMTSTILIGMGENDKARSLLGLTYSKINDKVHVSGKLRGTLQKVDADSSFGVRVDYQTSSGYVKSVLYTSSITSDSRNSIFPWGTKKRPDLMIKVKNIMSFDMDIKKNAPSGWNGNTILSFDMQNTGKWTEAKLKLS